MAEKPWKSVNNALNLPWKSVKSMAKMPWKSVFLVLEHWKNTVSETLE